MVTMPVAPSSVTVSRPSVNLSTECRPPQAVCGASPPPGSSSSSERGPTPRPTPVGQAVDVSRPVLKQFLDLSPLDFEQHPVWIACHVADYDESWYEETDEETFRPYLGSLPARPTGAILVLATATTSDGASYAGFLTPAAHSGDLGTLQPHMFVGDRAYGFWGGIVGIPAEERWEFLTACAKDEAAVFPIRFTTHADLSTGATEVEITGWL